MESINTFKTRSKIIINAQEYIYFDLNKLAKQFQFELSRVPNTIKVLLENLLRNEDKENISSNMISSLC